MRGTANTTFGTAPGCSAIQFWMSSDHLLDGVAVATAAEGAHDERLSAVGRGDAKDGLDAVGQRLVALALGAVVLQRVGADGLGDDQHVGAAHITSAREQHLGHVQRAVGEQRAAAVVAVLVVEVALVGHKDRVQVALGAQESAPVRRRRPRRRRRGG